VRNCVRLFGGAAILFDQSSSATTARIGESAALDGARPQRAPVALSEYVDPRPCVTHGDFRTDNLLIDACDGAVAIAVVDCRPSAFGSPLLDVAYFLATSLTPEDCAREEFGLLDYYLVKLNDYASTSRRSRAPRVLSLHAPTDRHAGRGVVLVEQTERATRCSSR